MSNQKPGKAIEWAVWGGLGIVLAAIVAAFVISRVGGRDRSLPVLGRISDFSLTNQNNEPVTLASLKGKVWVADIIFTRCPGPCAKMTRHLAEVQAALPANQPVRLVSLTSDPTYDTPAVLKKYADRFGADSNHWWFLTGDNPQIRRLAVNDFKFVLVEKKPEEREIPNDLFIHSTWFVLVDAQGRVRGWTDPQGQMHAYYDSEDAADRSRMLDAVNQLLREK